MKIIIAGAGAVGTHLARLLGQEQHDITLMDADKDRFSSLRENTELLTIEGRCTSLKDLENANINKADLFIAVTPEESQNITACMLANKLGAKKTLARIDNYEYLLPKNKEFFESLGIHSMIYPEMVAAKEIALALKKPWTRVWWELANGAVILSGAKVRNNAPIANKHLYEIPQSNKLFHLVAIKRDNFTLIPKGNDKILHNDLVYFITLHTHLDKLPEIFGKVSFEAKNIMIMGGSRIALRTVQFLPKSMNIKIIEQSRERAELLFEKVPSNVTIFIGDGRDGELLQSEGIKDMDAFLALTGNSEANVLACLAAKQYGVKKTIAEVENNDYISMAEKLDIGAVINKKMIAASKIYELLLKADASNIKNLNFANANVGEVVAKPNSLVTKKLIKNLNLPPNITFGALIRNDVPILVEGETQIEAYDKVVVVFLNNTLKSIEKLFN